MSPTLLLQPDDRGTAAAVLVAAHRIRDMDPEAMVVVFPCDHYIGDEVAFLGCVEETAAWLEGQDESLVLLGATPTEPDVGYGWIELGDPVMADGVADLYRVRRFLEKPGLEVAEACLARGGLWNTSVLVVRVRYLLDVGRRLLPELDSRLKRLAAFAGTEDERWAMQQAYALAPKADFSRQVLEPLAATLLVRRLPDVNWCDLGTPDRAVRTVARLARRPSWMESLHISA
jgi:mannose-1-phosphate guanylyltransferase